MRADGYSLPMLQKLSEITVSLQLHPFENALLPMQVLMDHSWPFPGGSRDPAVMSEHPWWLPVKSRDNTVGISIIRAFLYHVFVKRQLLQKQKLLTTLI